jgi:hypothetical protein
VAGLNHARLEKSYHCLLSWRQFVARLAQVHGHVLSALDLEILNRVAKGLAEILSRMRPYVDPI